MKLYTTLMTVEESRGIASALGHTFQAPPPPRELPSVPRPPTGEGQQRAGLPEQDPLHFWRGAENGFHQQSTACGSKHNILLYDDILQYDFYSALN